MSAREWIDRDGAAERARKALEILTGGQTDGAHHKMWVIDQAVRALVADYDEWVAAYEECDEDGEPAYEWDVGVAP